MTKYEVTDAMLEVAIEAWFRVVKGAGSNFLNGTPNPPVPLENLHDAMQAAITAAIEASGLVEENARLREGLNAKPWPPTDAELREMLAKIVSVWWSESSYQRIMTRDLSPFDIKGMYAVRDVLAPYVARAALNKEPTP